MSIEALLERLQRGSASPVRDWLIRVLRDGDTIRGHKPIKRPPHGKAVPADD
jgi:hypothetical protein